MRSALEVTGAWIEVWSLTLWAWIWAWIWALARWAWIWAPLLVPSVLVAPSASAEPPTVDYLALRLRQARERVPHLRVIAADNMPGECFTIDLDNKVIYFDALAPVDDQRRYLAAALGTILADPADQRRYLATALILIGCEACGPRRAGRPRLQVVYGEAMEIPAQRQRPWTPETVR